MGGLCCCWVREEEIKLPPDKSDQITGKKREKDVLGVDSEAVFSSADQPQQYMTPAVPQKPQLDKEIRTVESTIPMETGKSSLNLQSESVTSQPTSSISPQFKPSPSTIPLNPPFSVPNPTFQGLRNIGNTCFANSVLSSLYFIPELYTYFTHLEAATGLERAMKRFYMGFQGAGDREDTGELVAGVLKCMPEYDNRRQHRAYSFLNDLLTGLMHRKDGIQRIFSISIEEVCICTVCQSMRKKEFVRETMGLALIAGELQGEIEHFDETHFSLTQETGLDQGFMQLKDYKSALLRYFASHKPLNRPKSASFSLENSLKYALSTEINAGDSVMLCRSECDSDQTHLKQVFIRSIGPVLACYFERFNSNEPRAPVSIPLTLDMRKYVGNSGEYELIAVVNHSGNTKGGHYNSLVRVGNDQKGSKDWFSFNDSVVKMQKRVNFSRSTEGVIAFYRRIS